MRKSILMAAVLAGALAYSSAQAQSVTVTPGAMTYSGTITTIDPTQHTMILTSPQASAPVTYSYTPDTVFLDATGNTVSYEVIRNQPVTVEYTTVGGRTIVKRVIASR
jgi:hypothetical protein